MESQFEQDVKAGILEQSARYADKQLVLQIAITSGNLAMMLEQLKNETRNELTNIGEICLLSCVEMLGEILETRKKP